MKKLFTSGVLLVALCSMFLFSSFTFAGEKSNQDGELTIVANVTVKAEHKNDIMKAFKAVVDATRKEPGNVSYALYENVSDPLKFTFVEVWKSQQAIDEHNSSRHFNDFVKAVDGKADLEVLILKQKF